MSTTTDTASTLARNIHIGTTFYLATDDMPGESKIAQIACKAEMRAPLTCTAYDAKGKALTYAIQRIPGDTVTFDDPLLGKRGFDNPIVGITLNGVGDTFTSTSTTRVPLK